MFLFHFVEQRAKAQETNDDPLAEMEMANVIARKQKRPGIKTSSTVYSSNEVNNPKETTLLYLLYLRFRCFF